MARKLGTNLECDNLPFSIDCAAEIEIEIIGILYLICTYFQKIVCLYVMVLEKCI